MDKKCDILLVVIFMILVCKTYANGHIRKQLPNLPMYKCWENRQKYDNNSCVVKKVDYSGVNSTVRTLKPKPKYGRMTFQTYKSRYSNCDLYGKVTFAYTAMDVEVVGKVEGFEIELHHFSFSKPKYYTVTLPRNYQQSTGGIFTIGLTDFQIPPSIKYKIKALPNSQERESKITRDKNTNCVDPDEYKKMNCNESGYVEYIPICETPTNKTTDVVETTSPPTTTSSTTVPVAKHSRNLLVVGLMIVFVLIICFAGAAVMRKRIHKEVKKKRAVILASSGDNTSKFTDLANLIASELKLSNEFEEVFFTGWLQVNKLGSNLEQLLDALHRSTVVILFASPYGKTSYEKFLEQGQLATWKDEFILGAHSLFRPSNHTTIQSRIKSKRCTVYVVYQSNDKLNKSDLLHDDFERHAHRCYDLSIPHNNTALYKKLLRRRKIQSLADDQEPGGDNENATTTLI